MDFKKLDSTVLQVKTDLESKFPNVTFDCKPYYCGMGYCGIRITIDKEDKLSEVTTYYDSKFHNENGKKFFKRVFCIKDDPSNTKSNDNEIMIAGQDKAHEALPIFRDVYDTKILGDANL